MIAEKFTQLPMRRAVFAATLARLVGQPQFHCLQGIPVLHRFAGRKEIQTPDPVLLRIPGSSRPS